VNDSLSERDFREMLENLFFDIEDIVESFDQDFDIDGGSGILTITFPDASQVIFSRQVSQREVWIAARSGGFHLSFANGQWQCGTTSEILPDLLNRVFSEQTGDKVTGFDSVTVEPE
jgi:CyaY protein